MSKIKVGIPIKYNENGLFSKWQMKIIKKKALNASIKTGRTHYIIPSGKGSLLIIDNRWRKLFNKHNKKKLTFVELLRIAYFATPKIERVIN